MSRSRSFLLPPLAWACAAALAWLAAPAPGLLAQQPPAPGTSSTAAAATSQIERSRLPNPTLPLSAAASVLGDPAGSGGASDSQAPATQGDPDLGIQSLLKPSAERIRPWTVFVDGGFINTTNVALTKRDTLNDTFAVAELGVGYERKLREDLTLSLSVRQQYFAYERFGDLDFGSLNLGAGLAYALPARWLGAGVVASAQLGFTRLTRQSLAEEEFYRSGTLSLGLQKFVPIGRAQLLCLGGDAVLSLSVPHLPQRQELGLSAGYLVQLTRHLSLQAGTRAAYFNYSTIAREDFNLSVSSGATYAFNPYASLGATLSGTLDRSSRAVFDYNVLNSGASLFFHLKF